MKGRHKVIKIQPFDEPVNIVVNKSIKKCIKYTNKYHKHKHKLEFHDYKNCDGMHYETPDKHRFVFLQYNSSIHTVVHECFHAVMKSAKMHGGKHCKKSEEFYAYSLGEFTEQVMNFFYGIKEVKEHNMNE